MKVFRFLLTLCLGVSLLAVSCVPQLPPNPFTQSGDQKSVESPPGDTQAITIGAIYPLTGSQAPYGLAARNGTELAVDIVNNAYPDLNLPLAGTKGLPNFGGAPLRVVFADNAGSTSQSGQEAQQLVDQEKVAALIGSYSSDNTNAASAVADQKGVPFVAPLSTAVELTDRQFKGFFRTTPNDATFSQGIFQFLAAMRDQKGVPISTVATVYQDSLFGVSSSFFEDQAALSQGFRVVADVSYPVTTTSLSDQVQTIKSANPDVLIASSYTDDAILLLRALRDLDFTPQALLAQDAGFTEASFLQTVAGDAEGIISREAFSLDLADKMPLVAQVNQLYRARYDSDLDGTSARAFVGTLVLADALNRAGSTDAEAIRKALAATNIPPEQLIVPWDGVRFDASGQNTLGKAILVQVQEGRYHLIWPFDLAATDIHWPLVSWSQR